jgi:hypothetical protein
MPKEERIRADRQLRESHLKKTITWHNLRIARFEREIMSIMRSNDPDCSYLQQLINRRENFRQKCKDQLRKLYGG